MSNEVHLPIDTTLFRLRNLDNHPSVISFISNPDSRNKAENLVLTGFNQLIDRFNILSGNGLYGSSLLSMTGMEKSRALVDLLKDNQLNQLPQLEEVDAQSYLSGLREGVAAFEAGQRARKGQEAGQTDIVKTPSMKTHPLALIIGTAGHLYERSVFNWLRARGITEINEGMDEKRPFKVDDVLYALGECALLMHAEARFGDRSHSPDLLKYMATPNADNETGGLGWRRGEHVHAYDRQYALYQLKRAYERATGEILTETVEQLIEKNQDSFPTLEASAIKYFEEQGLSNNRIGAMIGFVFGRSWENEVKSQI